MRELRRGGVKLLVSYRTYYILALFGVLVVYGQVAGHAHAEDCFNLTVRECAYSSSCILDCAQDPSPFKANSKKCIGMWFCRPPLSGCEKGFIQYLDGGSKSKKSCESRGKCIHVMPGCHCQCDDPNSPLCMKCSCIMGAPPRCLEDVPIGRRIPGSAMSPGLVGAQPFIAWERPPVLNKMQNEAIDKIKEKLIGQKSSPSHFYISVGNYNKEKTILTFSLWHKDSFADSHRLGGSKNRTVFYSVDDKKIIKEEFWQ